MYNACLRWSDLSRLTFGDFSVTDDSLRLFIASSKTDPYHQGHFITLPRSDSPLSTYSLLIQCLHRLHDIWSSLSTTHIRHHAFNPHPFSSRSSPLSRYKPSLTALSCLLSKHGHRQSAFHPTSLAHTAFVAALPPTGHYMASLTMFALHMAVGVPLPRLTPTLAMMPPLNSSSKPSPALHHHPHRM